VEKEKAAIARQRCGKHVSIASNQHATIQDLLEAVFRVVHPKARYQGPMGRVSQLEVGVDVSSFELQVSSGSLWLAMKNLHCQQLLPSNDY
jgi:hypothetical protein